MNTDFIAIFSFISSGDTLGTDAASSANGAAPSYKHAYINIMNVAGYMHVHTFDT